jgi:hypothetical protein
MKSKAALSRIASIFLGLPWVEILTEAWKHGRKLLNGMTSEGIYEVLDYEMFLELHDIKGTNATYRKHEEVKYLQNNVIAYHDQAWGDGKILQAFRCSPGRAVDRYRLGHKTLILISLRKVRNRGDRDDLNIEWNMKNTFTRKNEEWTTSVSHHTRKLQINVTFPEKRPPLKMTMVEINLQKEISLGRDYLKRLPDGRWQLSWKKKSPHLYEDYTFRWEW